VTSLGTMTVIPNSDFGNRVRTRLREESLIWFTTVGADGTPQPNPVWFLWEEDTSTVLIYNATNAARLEHVAVRPRIALNFHANAGGGDVVVLTGVAEQALDAPPVDRHDAYLAKYAEGIKNLGSDAEKFARDYSVPLRIRITKVRGF
jgi:PPOX class probable F420-dependent enzyme